MRWHQWHYMTQTLRQHMQRCGYDPIQSPTLEPADLFLTRAGNKIIHHLFTFERHGQQLALRPEFTASLARRYLQTQAERTPGTVERWQIAGPIFQDIPNGHSRTYQAYSIGAEMIGAAGPTADAEIIALAVEGITEVSTDAVEVRLGNVGLQMHLLAGFGLDKRTIRILLAQRELLRNGTATEIVMARINEFLPTLSRSGDDQSPALTSDGENLSTHRMLDVLLDSTQYGTTMGGRTRHEIARRLLEKHRRAAEYEQIKHAIDFLKAWCAIDAPAHEAIDQLKDLIPETDTIARRMLDDWHTTLHLLDHYALPRAHIRLQPDLTPNWEYYTGMVFNVRIDEQIVASGGRYDELIRLLGADESVPAVGFAIYVDQLAVYVSKPETHDSDKIVVSGDPAAVIVWAQRLRSQGIAAITQPTALSNSQAVATTQDKIAFENKTYSADDLSRLVADIKATLIHE